MLLVTVCIQFPIYNLQRVPPPVPHPQCPSERLSLTLFTYIYSMIGTMSLPMHNPPPILLGVFCCPAKCLLWGIHTNSSMQVLRIAKEWPQLSKKKFWFLVLSLKTMRRRHSLTFSSYFLSVYPKIQCMLSPDTIQVAGAFAVCHSDCR